MGLEIEGKSFLCLFGECVGEKKMAFVHKWSSLSCGSAEEDSLDVAAAAWGENIVPLPRLEEKGKSSPWRSVRHSQV